MEAYFDNSATTKVLDCVKDAVVDAMCVNYGNAAAKHRKGNERFPVSMRLGDTPVPIPNTMVKT